MHGVIVVDKTVGTDGISEAVGGVVRTGPEVIGGFIGVVDKGGGLVATEVSLCF